VKRLAVLLWLGSPFQIVVTRLGDVVMFGLLLRFTSASKVVPYYIICGTNKKKI